MKKLFVSPLDLMMDSFNLARQIIASGFHPDAMITFWRGGCPIAMAMDEYFRKCNLDVDIFVVNGDMPIERINSFDFKNILLVDDIFDTGQTIRQAYLDLASENMKREICSAVVYNKPGCSETDKVPSFYIRTVMADTWVVFPHELVGLSGQEDWQEKRSSLLNTCYSGTKEIRTFTGLFEKFLK
jgi:hypoxanthine phosphoribosyltransferase